jgi:hypothetical protein
LRRMWLLAIALLPAHAEQSPWGHLEICLEGNASCFGYWENDCPEFLEKTSHAFSCYQPCQFAWACQTFFIGVHWSSWTNNWLLYTTAGETDDTDASVLSAVNDLNFPVPLVPSEKPGVFLSEEGSADELPGVEAHDVAIIPKPTGVDLGGSQPEPPQVEAVFDDATFDTAVDGGPKQ